MSGEFLVSPGGPALALACTGLLGSAGADTKAVTHSSAEDKAAVRLVFRPDQATELQPVFSLAIVQQYDTYWTDIEV